MYLKIQMKQSKIVNVYKKTNFSRPISLNLSSYQIKEIFFKIKKNINKKFATSSGKGKSKQIGFFKSISLAKY